MLGYYQSAGTLLLLVMRFSKIVLIVALTCFLFYNNKDALALSITEKSPSISKKSLPNLRGPIAISSKSIVLKKNEAEHYVVIERGSKFPCAMTTTVDSFEVSTGDPVSAMLLVPIKIKESIVIEAGSRLRGWVSGVYKKRRVLSARLSPDRWLNSNAGIKLHFDSVVTDEGVIRLSAEPAPNSALLASDSPFPYVVNDHGEIRIDYSGLKYGAAGVAIQATSYATGPFSLVVGPVLSGTCGMIAPSYALDRPVEEIDDKTRRQGFLQGAVKGLPGGALLLGAKHKGLSVRLNAGIQLILELKEDLVISKSISASLL